MSTMDDAIDIVCRLNNIQGYLILIQITLWMIYGCSVYICKNIPIYNIEQYIGGVINNQPATINHTIWGSIIFLIWCLTLLLYTIYMAMIMAEYSSIMQYCTPNHIFYYYFNK